MPTPNGEMNRLFGIIDSMTPDERRNPSKTIDQSRRRRIAAGAGVRAARSERAGQAVRRHGRPDEGNGRHGHARPDAKDAGDPAKPDPETWPKPKAAPASG